MFELCQDRIEMLEILSEKELSISDLAEIVYPKDSVWTYVFIFTSNLSFLEENKLIDKNNDVYKTTAEGLKVLDIYSKVNNILTNILGS